MEILKWSVETFFSKAWEAMREKVGEKLLDSGLDGVNLKSTLRTLQRSSTSLSAKASDVEEEIKKAERSGKKKRKREVEHWLNEVKTIEIEFLALVDEVQREGFFRKFLGGDRAVELNARVQELVDQSRHFGELVLDVSKPVKFPTNKWVGGAFQKNLERIWRLLVDDKVSSIGIFGMGGVGKTTLAKHINNRLVKENRGRVIWVTVSQEFSVHKLQDQIARLLELDLSDEPDEEKRAASLNDALSQGKDYVLIFDDVWKHMSLEMLGDPLRVEGCRLVITTRSSKVCHHFGCEQVIQVKTLQENESWRLFRETLGPDTVLAPQVTEIAKLVVKECDGLPLGIITLAGSLRRVTAAHSWSNVLEELRESATKEHHDMEDKVFKVLKYSFDRLDRGEEKSGFTELQRCFLYCGLWPEDYKIPREELIRKFISEELVDKRKSRKAQVDLSNDMLDELVNVCLLENTYDSKGVVCVKLHDLVRDLALRITRGKTIVLAGQNLTESPSDEEWPMDLETMSLMHNKIKDIRSGSSPNCHKLSTLLLRRNRDLGFIEDSFFTRMRGLCILDLSKSGIKELPNSISNLESLKALLLGQCDSLVNVPDLGNLKALRDLDLSYTSIREVPQGMEELVNLNWLSLDGADDLEMVRRGVLSKLLKLQCLFLPQHIEAPIDEIERLEQLEEFGGLVKDVPDFNRFIKFRKIQLKGKGVTASYRITVGEVENGLFGEHDNEFLGIGSSSLANNSVILGRCDLMRDKITLEKDTQRLKLVSCEGLRRRSLTDNISFNSWESSSLKSLGINCCKNIECVLTNEQLVATTAKSSESRALLFQNLERIGLWCLPDLLGIVIDRVESRKLSSSTPLRQTAVSMFSSVKHLHIVACDKMKKLGLRLADELPNLECIRVQECDEIDEIIEIEEPRGGRKRQQKLVSLPKLKELVLINNPRLKSICKSPTLLKCPSIEEIELRGCLALERRLPLHFPATLNGDYSLPSLSLRSIQLVMDQQEWWESLEWDHPSHPKLLQPLLSFD